MIDELLQDVHRLRNEAQGRRREARKRELDRNQRDRLLAQAAAGFQAAITALERGLRTVRRTQSQHTVDLCRILQALSQTYASLGGTRRDAKDFKAAAEQYDRGNDYEEERRKNCRRFIYDSENLGHDTFNMLQRRIVRLLDDGSRLIEPEFVAELDAVGKELDKEFAEGRKDSWGLADLALYMFLRRRDDATATDSISQNQTLVDEVTARLEALQAQPTFYESVYHAVEALIEEGLGSGEVLGERLQRFSRLLHRNGGFARHADQAH